MLTRRQLALFGAILVGVLLALLILYFAFIRTSYVPLYENLRENDAAVVVKELDKQGITFDLANGGHDILVAEPELAKARLAIAGSDMPLGGTVGFELFNESDMGLTEFAQKVNYQRALQGELSRTIMGLQGVKFARVHLALPEKTIFRAALARPTAAVTVQTVGGEVLAAEQVVGIQQLVASSVSDMSLNNVAILNDEGDLLSSAVTGGGTSSAPVDEKAALEQYARVRIEAAVARFNPRLPIEAKVFATRTDAGPSPAKEDDATNGAAAPPAVPPSARTTDDYRLRAVLRTATPLSAEDADFLRNSIVSALALKEASGDVLIFEVGPLGMATAETIAPAAPQPGPSASPSAAKISPTDFARANPLLIAALLFGLLIVGIAITLWQRKRQRLSEEEQQSFASLLADELALQRPSHAG